MVYPLRCFSRAGLVAASALLFTTLSDKLPFPALGAESFNADSGEGIYSDTRSRAAGLIADAGERYGDRRAYSSSVIMPYDPDSGDGIYSDTRRMSSKVAGTAFDADSGDGIYSDTRAVSANMSRVDVGFDADSGEGVYSDTSEWDDGDDYAADYPDYWSNDIQDTTVPPANPVPSTPTAVEPAPVPAEPVPTPAPAPTEPVVAEPVPAPAPIPAEPAPVEPAPAPTESVAAEPAPAPAEPVAAEPVPAAPAEPAPEAWDVPASGMDDSLQGLFDNAEDQAGVEAAPITAPANAEANSEKKINWWGQLDAKGGIIFRIFPEGNMSPFFTLSNTLGFTAKPFDDFVVRGSFYSEFPAFNFDLTTLYFDYIMNDKLYITAGKTGTAWGVSQIFDTNILDDEGDGTVINPYADETATGNRFDAILTLPIWKGEIQGVGMYSIGQEMSKDNLSFAGKVQYPIGPVSLELFGRKWATSDKYYMQPAFGMSLTTDIFRNHAFLWGKAHVDPKDPTDLDFVKLVGGVSRIIETSRYGKIGFAAEYQLTYDPDLEEDKRMTHDIALSLGWSHAMRSDFSPAVRWWYNPVSKQGYVLPSLTYTGLRHMDITLTVPYIFGGASYSYGDVTWASTKDEPLVVFGLIFSLSVPY